MHVSKVVAILACAIGTHAGPQERQVADPTVVSFYEVNLLGNYKLM